MHISTGRFITTLQYPLAPPLPVLTDGYHPSNWDMPGCAQFIGRTVDASLTACVRLVVTPLLTTVGAARLGWQGMHAKSLAVLPLMVLGAGCGSVLGAVGCFINLADVGVSCVGAVVVFVWVTGNAAADGMGRGLRSMVQVCGQLTAMAAGGL